MSLSTSGYIVLFALLTIIAYLIFSFENNDKGDAGKSKEDKEEAALVMVCPRCGSTNIELDSNTYKAAAEFGGKLYYRCKTCGLIAPTFPLMDKKSADKIESGS